MNAFLCRQKIHTASHFMYVSRSFGSMIWITYVVVMDIEDFEIRGIQLLVYGNISASLWYPAWAPLIVGRRGRFQNIPKTSV